MINFGNCVVIAIPIFEDDNRSFLERIKNGDDKTIEFVSNALQGLAERDIVEAFKTRNMVNGHICIRLESKHIEFHSDCIKVVGAQDACTSIIGDQSNYLKQMKEAIYKYLHYVVNIEHADAFPYSLEVRA